MVAAVVIFSTAFLAVDLTCRLDTMLLEVEIALGGQSHFKLWERSTLARVGARCHGCKLQPITLYRRYELE